MINTTPPIPATPDQGFPTSDTFVAMAHGLAGIAVICAVLRPSLNVQPTRIHIAPATQEGRVEFSPPLSEQPLLPTHHRAQVLRAYSGILARLVFLEGPQALHHLFNSEELWLTLSLLSAETTEHGVTSIVDQVKPFLKALPAEHGGPTISTLGQDKGDSSEVYGIEHDGLARFLAATAGELVLQCWPTIEHVALALLQTHDSECDTYELSHDALHAVLSAS